MRSCERERIATAAARRRGDAPRSCSCAMGTRMRRTCASRSKPLPRHASRSWWRSSPSLSRDLERQDASLRERRRRRRRSQTKPAHARDRGARAAGHDARRAVGRDIGDDAKFGLGARETLFLCSMLRGRRGFDGLRLLPPRRQPGVGHRHDQGGAGASRARCTPSSCGWVLPWGSSTLEAGWASTTTARRAGAAASVNYDAVNYANDAVAALADACTRAGIEPPTIVSESGRATSPRPPRWCSNHLHGPERRAGGEGRTGSRAGAGTNPRPRLGPRRAPRSGTSSAPTWRRSLDAAVAFLLHNFREVARSPEAAETANVQEAINDATQFRRRRTGCLLGIMGLEERAEAEELFCATRERLEIVRARRPEGLA